MDANCQSCIYWDSQEEEDVGLGYCRRNPPVGQWIFVGRSARQHGSMRLVSDKGVSVFAGHWPETIYSDWCGDIEILDTKSENSGFSDN